MLSLWALRISHVHVHAAAVVLVAVSAGGAKCLPLTGHSSREIRPGFARKLAAMAAENFKCPLVALEPEEGLDLKTWMGSQLEYAVLGHCKHVLGSVTCRYGVAPGHPIVEFCQP